MPPNDPLPSPACALLRTGHGWSCGARQGRAGPLGPSAVGILALLFSLEERSLFVFTLLCAMQWLDEENIRKKETKHFERNHKRANFDRCSRQPKSPLRAMEQIASACIHRCV